MSANTLPVDQEQALAHRMYNLYSSYRFMLAVIFFILAVTPATPLVFTAVTSSAAVIFSLIYGAQALGTMMFLKPVPNRTVMFAITFLDIILLCILLTMSSVNDNGLTNLLFIPIAIGNTLIPGRIGVLLTAMASIFLLFIDYYMGFSQELDAGLTGLLFFAATLIIQSYNLRLKSTVSSAMQSQSRAINLQQLSLTIMQHMRTGIVVLREPSQVLMMNEAASHMLATRYREGNLDQISNPLQTAYWQWKENPQLQLDSFRTTPDTPEVQPSFTRLTYESDVFVLVFLDDKASMAQQAQQLKLASLGQLTASIAHEIRNPLGAISHSAQLMEESENLDKYDQKLLGIIHKHCNRMNEIIETILQLSRKESWHPEKLDLNGWLQHFIQDEYFSGFETPAIQFHPMGKDESEQSLWARFDIKQLHQVVMNLSLNGLRYSQQKTGTASLEMRTGISPSGHPWLEIIDQGPGIPEDQRDSIFNPFFTTDKNGTGLGLYISRELCEANQASLELLPPDETGGCIFRISFAHPDKRITGV
ncbi:sensor histidine kinase [Parendozoicomonas haliclonae]|uniref:histidine kinase n=1 Tax=Parendozoicomonas haliclonae TaxID=1960125 RepID=A0A1X7APZ4_9GAMM|nr:ATP-binding protein [Parendozoicomonas haliclonae]SMA50384.1 Sensor protein ZraS [Parendozoicomonas haliclonae]